MAITGISVDLLGQSYAKYLLVGRVLDSSEIWSWIPCVCFLLAGWELHCCKRYTKTRDTEDTHAIIGKDF